MGVLNFVLGTAVYDHQELLVNRLAEELADHPHDRFFYIVPNHIKFTSEVNVLRDLQEKQGIAGTYAQSQVQILSLSRLAWYLLRDTGTYQADALSTIGANMVMTNLVQQHQAEMGMYASEINHAGFIGHLTSQVNQLLAANIAPADLRAVADQAPANQREQSWVERLRILAKVEEWYGQKTSGYLSTVTEYQQLINELNNRDFADCHFYFDRFTQFTATELAVVKAMIVNGQSTTISLILDRAYRRKTLPEVNNLFYTAGRQYARLWRFADSHPGVKVNADLRTSRKRVANADLEEVEKAMMVAARYGVDRPVELHNPANVQCFTATDRVAELGQVVTKIRQLVETGQYRYRDILVLTRHLANYADVIEPLFAQQDIPVFNDHEKQMVNHPLVILIKQLFQLVKGGFQTETLMALLKTGLLVPKKIVLDDEHVLSTAAVDPQLVGKEKKKAVRKMQGRIANQFLDDVFTTENWCLKYGINSSDWLSDQPWHANFTGEEVASPAYQKVLNRQTAALNRVKNYVQQVLVPFVNHLSGAQVNGNQSPQQVTGRQFATVLYDFLSSKADVTSQLKRWSRQMAITDLAAARQSQQVWQELCGLLDQFVDLLGNEKTMTPQEFGEVLNNGMQAATYSQIPSTLDQVLISETGIIQDNHRKVVFILGATDDVMPETKKTAGLLNDGEIERINKAVGRDRYLPQSASGRLKNEPFLAYLSMMMGTEKLIMSAPLVADAEDSSGLELSPYLVAVANHFGLWDRENKQLITNRPGLPDAAASFPDVKPFVGTAQSTAGLLLRVLRAAKENRQTVTQRRKPATTEEEEQLLGPAWAAIHRELTGTGFGSQWTDEFDRLRTGLYYSNETTKLPPALATALYTVTDPHDEQRRILRSSISALQTFYRNPYQYFLEYGLGLKERDLLEIKPSNAGTFFHDGLAELIHLTPGKDLTSQTPAQVAALASRAADFAIKQQPDLERYTKRYARFRFQLAQMRSIVATMAQVMKIQAAGMDAVPLVTEQPFGTGVDRDEDATKDLDQITIDLAPLTTATATLQRQLAIRGRIDRIDKMAANADHGRHNDQFMVVDYKSSDHPFSLANALGGVDLQILAYLNALQGQLSELDESAVKPAIVGANYLHLQRIRFDYPFTLANLAKSSNYQFHGVLDNTAGVLEGLNQEFDFFGFSVNKSGKVRTKSGSLVTDHREFQQLLAANRRLLKEAASQILDGTVALQPFRLIAGSKLVTGLDNSAYADIFHFDNVLDQRLYRELVTDEDKLKKQLKGEQ